LDLDETLVHTTNEKKKNYNEPDFEIEMEG
jgi:hypothetical protein